MILEHIYFAENKITTLDQNPFQPFFVNMNDPAKLAQLVNFMYSHRGGLGSSSTRSGIWGFNVMDRLWVPRWLNIPLISANYTILANIKKKERIARGGDEQTTKFCSIGS